MNYRSLPLTFLVCAVSLLFRPLMVRAEWGVSLLPASLNADRTLRLVAGQTQVISMALHADAETTARSDKHKLAMEIDVPRGMEIVHNDGFYTFSTGRKRDTEGRSVYSYDVEAANASIHGAPGTRVSNEWRIHTLFVKTPQALETGAGSVAVTVRDGEAVQKFEWPLTLQSMLPPAQRPRRTAIALWDYNYFRCNDAAASEGIVTFLKNAGVSFTHYSAYDVYHEALKKNGILAGGNTLSASFSSPEFPDEDASGRVLAGDYPDPQAIIDLPPNAAIPGVNTLLLHARTNDNFATFDFEPDGVHGFGAASVRAFKKRYKVSDNDFTAFRAYVAENRLNTFQSRDALISRIWKQWTEYRSQVTAAYIGRIREALRAAAPEVKLAVTMRRSHGAGTDASIAIGTDNSTMARHTDIVMPQIYGGYGAVATKNVIDTTIAWKKQMQNQGARGKLWPLLLVRYAGASVHNTPQRLRQQAIGCLAQGAHGIGFYYPANMDAPYWEMLARLNEDIARYENFYRDGRRVEARYKLSDLPKGVTEISMWPGYVEKVENPAWAFTAHELGNKVLLTLINLEEANDMVFGVETGPARIESAQGAELLSGAGDATETGAVSIDRKVTLKQHARWLVGPGQTAFVVLEKSPVG